MYRKLLVATDGSEMATKAVAQAGRLANALGARLLVLHVRSPIDVPHYVEGGALTRLGEDNLMQEIEIEERKLLQVARGAAESTGAVAEVAFITEFQPYEAIVRVCQEQQCDLIVMATRIRQGIPGFLTKSETQKVLIHTSTPVLVLR